MRNGRGRSVWRLAHVTAGIALALIGTPARAADDAPPGDHAGVALQVDAIGPGQLVDIDVVQGSIHDTLPVATCSQACTNLVVPGLVYRVRLRAAADRALHTTFVRVEDPIALHVVQRDPTLRDVGLGLFIGGSVLLATGLLGLTLTGWGGLGGECSGSGCTLRDAVFLYGAIAAPLGLVMMPTGAVMRITTDFHFRRESIDAPAPPSAAMPLVHVGVVPVPGGATAGLSFRF
jgi:hypothetical protein